MIEREVIAGDTFSLTYKYMPEGVLTDMPEAYNIKVGLHTEGGSLVRVYSYLAGEIKNPDKGIYRWTIDYDTSKNLKGYIIAEMMLYSSDKSVVVHCSEPIRIHVIPSLMNSEIEND